MKVLASSALALSAVFFAVPVTAHHNSIDPDFVESVMQGDLTMHNEQVEDVLLELGDMGSGTRAGDQVSAPLDPADTQQGATQGATCSVLVDGVCDGDAGNDVMSGVDSMSGEGTNTVSGFTTGMSRSPAPVDP